MDFVDHDLKSLMEDMTQNFLQSEVKTLMQQLLSATEHMHGKWILHRDLKTSNLLMTNRGMIKIADFGLSRYHGDPAPPMTQLIVTLWYRFVLQEQWIPFSKEIFRSPEILLGTHEYGTAVDMWSIGCIFAELLTREPLIRGKGEIDQLSKVIESYLTHSDPSRYSILSECPQKRPGRASWISPTQKTYTFQRNSGNANTMSQLVE